MSSLKRVLFWVGVAALVVAGLAAHGSDVHVSWNVMLCAGLVGLALSRAPE